MAMSFGNAGNVPGVNAQQSNGDEIQEIAVECLAFKALNGENKLKLLRQPWPLDDLPSSTSSLLSISSRQGLLAAAGPNSLVLAETKAVRDAFSKQGSGDNNVVDFQPALEITVPKLSQVAFTADGEYLVICAQDGGGLQVHESQSLLKGYKDPVFALPTSGISIRALSPNPAPESSHLIAIILNDGKLLLADLKSRDFMKTGSGSPALREGVAAVSWSVRGKQLTAGMADGTCVQLDHQGVVKASIPPPQLPVPCHVSSLVWLSNNDWLIYHTANSSDEGQNPESFLHYVITDKDRAQFTYHKPSYDPVGSFGANRVPITHYISRLRNWHNVKDWLVMTSVASIDVAMLTNSSMPLASDNQITNAYTVTGFSNDTAKITMPMSVMDAADTTAIGMALDLSSKDKVHQPIPGDEMDESPFPLPAIMLLNNEGILISSWLVYNDALRNNVPCPDMTNSAESVTSPPQTPQVSAFGGGVTSPQGSAFGGGGFAKPAAPSFASFGTSGGSAQPAFGGASAMGGRQSVWGGSGAGAAAAKPAFGQSSMGAAKPAFGSTSAFGASATNGASPFGGAASNTNASAKPAFGSTSAFGAAANGGASPFGAASNTSKPAASPFGAFAGSGNNAAKSTASPFGAASSGQSAFGQLSKPGTSAFASTTGSSFGGMSSQPSFGSTVSVDTSAGGSTLGNKSVFGTPSTQGGAFGKPSLTPSVSNTQESDMMDDGDKAPTPKEEKKGGLFGGEPFKLGTTFKPGNQEDKADSDDEKKDKKTEERPKGLFGADFGAALGDTRKEREKSVTPKIKEEPKETSSLFGIPAAPKQEDDKPKPSIFGSTSTPSNKSSSPFSFGKPSSTPSSTLKPEPAPPEVQSKPAPSPSTTTAPSTESKASSKGASEESEPLAGSPAEKVGIPESDDDDLASDEEEVVDDAPLPPDPSTVKVKAGFYDVNKTLGIKEQPKPAAQPVQPTAQPKPLFGAVSPAAQPQKPAQQSLFGGAAVSPAPESQKPIFGSSTTPAGFPKAPQMFAPPAPAVPKSPRSPSPIRSASTPLGRPTSRPSSVRPQFTPSLPPPTQQQAPQPPTVTPRTLQDKEAERNHVILSSPPQPTLDLASYISHQDYVGPSGLQAQTSTSKVPAQIETLFRDINSMVDTLGLNARALTEFIEGHNSLLPDNGRTREDLDEGDEGDWCLVEIEDLMTLETEMGDELEGERIEDKDVKVREMLQMRRELVRAKNKVKEVKRFIEQAGDEEKLKQRKNAPLDKATEARQREIRHDMSRFLKVLVEAEEAVSMLKVKLATAQSSRNPGQVPTVEAVEKTVKKMTVWAEAKGADMDVLEAQMKKLGLVGGTPKGHSKRASLNGSSMRRSLILSTPSPKKSPPKRSTFAVPEESDSEDDSFVEIDAREVVVKEMVEARKRKTAVMGKVRDAMRRRGVKINEVKQ